MPILDVGPGNPRAMSLDAAVRALQTTLQDERLAPVIRVGLARLQLPWMRQGAVARPGDDSHPATTLVELLVACALGTDGNAVAAEALEAEINRLVWLIEQREQADEETYRQAHAEFKTFLTRHQTTRKPLPPLADEVHQKSQKDVFAVQCTLLLRQMMHEISVRPEVTDFLFKVWAEVLAFASVRYGHQHAQTLALKQTVTALIWATGAKKTRRNRARVIKDVPQLLQTLRNGMDLLGLPEDEKNRHITTLSAPMMDAFLGKKLHQPATPPRLDDAPKLQKPGPGSVVRSKTARVSSLPGMEVIEDVPSSQGWQFWERVQAEQTDPVSRIEATDSTWSNPRGHRER